MRNRPSWLILLVCGLALGAAQTAAAQIQLGARAGVSADPTQFVLGLHVDAPTGADRISFRPNAEVGTGDNVFTANLNLEIVYKHPISTSPWSAYAGGGPALNYYSYNRKHPKGTGTDWGAGLNLLVGVEHSAGLFGEFKFGTINSPSVKFSIGYSITF